METDFLITSSPQTLGSVQLHAGNEALAHLLDNKFMDCWDSLYQACPWGTVFQSKEFVLTWYETYAPQWMPVLVRAENNGTATGILTLAKASNRLFITGAGEHSAEYHTWLSSREHSDEFIMKAVRLIQQQFRGCILELKFTSADTPLGWLATDSGRKFRRVIRRHDQPIIAIDENHFLKKLNAKTIREKIKRLKKKGDLRLERITDRQEFEEVIDEMLLQFEFRKGALYNTFPTHDDPLFRPFLLNLFEKDLLHVTVLRLDKQIIASMINTAENNWVYLKGINTHAASFARQSPGLLHFLMLGKLLADENVGFFDLTPGGDYYKEGLATSRLAAHQIWLMNSLSAYAKISLREWIKKLVRETVSRKGIDPRLFLRRSNQAKEALMFARKQGLLYTIKRVFGSRKTNDNITIYRIKPDRSFIFAVNQDSLADLLQFDQNGSAITRWTFLEKAMKCFEFGGRSFTTTKNGRLLACVWLKGKMELPGTPPGAPLPEKAVILQNLYCHKDFKKDFSSFLSAVASEALGEEHGIEVFAVAGLNDMPPSEDMYES
ncbi:MAG TPA: GNAT family N-acetyltransferase [Sphingobacteriaceae bacterium]